MNKPVMKREVAVDFALSSVKTISFFASNDAVTEFKDFGVLTEDCFNVKDKYNLIVDARYDFKEVLEYIENYG